MSPAEWSKVTERVVFEAANAHADDVVLDLAAGTGSLSLAFAPHVRRVIAFDESDGVPRPLPANVEVQTGTLTSPPLEGVSIVVGNDALSRLSPAKQSELLRSLGRVLPERALLVLGDVMWSLDPGSIDEPEQFGLHPENAPTTAWIEREARAAGFLPDLHRFGVGRAVLVALRAKR